MSIALKLFSCQLRLAVPVLTVIVVIALGGCTDHGGSERYFPLEPGINWQYRVERTTMDGTFEMRQAIAAIHPPNELSGVTAAKETLAGQRYLYSGNDHGLYQVGEYRHGQSKPDPALPPQLVLPREVSAESRWTAISRTQVLENTGPPWETLFRIDVPVALDYVVESLDATIVTPAGQFEHCLLIAGSGTTNVDVGNYIGHTQIDVETRQWLAPGVGLVRLERKESTAATALSEGSMTMELDAWYAN